MSMKSSSIMAMSGSSSTTRMLRVFVMGSAICLPRRRAKLYPGPARPARLAAFVTGSSLRQCGCSAGTAARRNRLIAHVVGNNAAIFGKLIHDGAVKRDRSEEHTSELQSLMRISYAVFCLKKKKKKKYKTTTHKKIQRNKQSNKNNHDIDKIIGAINITKVIIENTKN